jgi:hypothetical protein
MKVIYWFAAYLFVGLWLAVSLYVLKFNIICQKPTGTRLSLGYWSHCFPRLAYIIGAGSMRGPSWDTRRQLSLGKTSVRKPPWQNREAFLFALGVLLAYARCADGEQEQEGLKQ